MFDYAILGLGKTGLAVLDYLARKEPHKKILVSDAADNPRLAALLRERYPFVASEFGGHSERVLDAAEVIKSPGLPAHLPVLQKLREKGIPVVSEIDFAFKRLAAKPAFTIGVTGTNGKTTTTHLISHLLSGTGRKAAAVGNIGAPLISEAGSIGPWTFLILELSSYQLEDSSALKLDAAVILNITPDHLDHHGSWDAYVAAKSKIVHFASRGCVILNFEDKTLRNIKGVGRSVYFSSARVLKEGAWLERGLIRLRWDQEEYGLAPCPHLMGTHNLENQMAAILAVAAAGVKVQEIEGPLASYRPPPHRLEQVAEIQGVLFVNDSKATNVESALVALKALLPLAERRGGRIHLLLGGLDKGSSYRPLAELGANQVEAYAYGSAREKIFAEFGPFRLKAICETLAQALEAARAAARPGDIILLSPACASFDQFADFEDRGEKFKAWVLKP